MAKDGYDGTGRYFPVPREAEIILSHRHIINVYLEALGLEQICEQDNFWTINVKTGWDSGWKRFDWSVSVAFDSLYHRAKIRTATGYISAEKDSTANLFLLLKGWEHLFVEV